MLKPSCFMLFNTNERDGSQVDPVRKHVWKKLQSLDDSKNWHQLCQHQINIRIVTKAELV